MSYRIESEENGVTLYSPHVVKVVKDFDTLKEMLGLLQVTEVISWDAFGDYKPHPLTDEQAPVEGLFSSNQ